MPVDPADYRPALADLGGIMRARTKDEDGDELGTFTEDTRPNDEAVEAILDRALGLVSGRLGSVREEAADLARSIVLLRAAMLVEVSYFPEETGAEDSSFNAYAAMYREALADYDAAVDRDVGDTQTKTASVAVKSATRLASDALAAEQAAQP